MTDQLNIDEFGKAMDLLGMQLSRLANRADELHRVEWEELNHSWEEALCSPELLQAALLTKALGVFDMTMDKMDEELRSSRAALNLVFAKLPDINEKES